MWKIATSFIVVVAILGCRGPVAPPTDDLDLDAILDGSSPEQVEISTDSRCYGFVEPTVCSGDRFVSTVMKGGERSLIWIMPRLKKSAIQVARDSGFLLYSDDVPDHSINGITLFFSLTFQRGTNVIRVETTATDDELAGAEGNYSVKITVHLVPA